MEVWSHEGRLFEYASIYLIQEDAWAHEVSEVDGDAWVSIVIPDTAPDEERFAPRPAAAELRSTDGSMPWPIVARLIDKVSLAGDLGPQPDASG